ncbi:albumin-2, partial [Trifolium pratense]
MPITPIDAAFNSFKHNECYVFVKDKYAVVNYAPGAKKHEILRGPIKTVGGFKVLAGTPFENGIDCAFENQHREAFIFSGNHCAKITYAPDHPHKPKILSGPKTIANMFTCLRGKSFEHGIDAAIRIHGKKVLLFKGNVYAQMDYHTNKLYSNHYIRNGFKSLVGTVFESGIDAAFKSDKKEEAYIFKNEYYARVSIVYGHTTGGHLL